MTPAGGIRTASCRVDGDARRSRPGGAMLQQSRESLPGVLEGGGEGKLQDPGEIKSSQNHRGRGWRDAGGWWRIVAGDLGSATASFPLLGQATALEDHVHLDQFRHRATAGFGAPRRGQWPCRFSLCKIRPDSRGPSARGCYRWAPPALPASRPQRSTYFLLIRTIVLHYLTT